MLDFYAQEHDENAWERSGVPDYYSGGEGWEWVEKNDNSSFMTAWYKAMAFAHEYGYDFDKM